MRVLFFCFFVKGAACINIPDHLFDSNVYEIKEEHIDLLKFGIWPLLSLYHDNTFSGKQEDEKKRLVTNYYLFTIQ